MLDAGQRRRLALADQRALGDLCAADAAGNRRGHRGIAPVDLGTRQRRLCRRHIGVGLRFRRHGLIEFLLADRIAGNQRLNPLQILAGDQFLRFAARQAGFGGCHIRRQRARVDLEQHLARLDLAALGVAASLQDAFHPRPDFRCPHRLQAAGRFQRARDIARCHADHFHFRRRHAASRTLRRRRLRFAGGERQQRGDGQHDEYRAGGAIHGDS